MKVYVRSIALVFLLCNLFDVDISGRLWFVVISNCADRSHSKKALLCLVDLVLSEL